MERFSTRSWSVSVLATVLASASCGGGGGGGTCGRVEPCGGNVAGNWTISGACMNSAALMQVAVDDGLTGFCPTSTVSNAKYDVSGTLSFNPDMSYAASLLATFRFDWTIQNACLQGTTCSTFNAAIQMYFQQNPDPSIQSITCAGSSTCVCTIQSAPQANTETGTYTSSGTTLVTTASDGTVSYQDFCVQGNSLHFVTVDTTMNMGPMGQATIDSDIVATKSP